MEANFASAPSVAFVTLGCAKNEVDTETMMRALAEAGFDVVDDVEGADAVIVNTCSFIQAATEESLEVIFGLAKLDHIAAGSAKLIVAGCMPARYGEELESELSEAGAFIPCSREDDIVSVVADTLGVSAKYPVAARQGGSAALHAADPQAESPVYAYVKISDGCDRFCSYCTIPYIRGRYHSFSRADIFQDVSRLTSGGVKEVVLIAQDTGIWGEDLEQPDSLAALVGDLADTYRDTWFRLMYIQPEGVSDELLDAIAAHNNICTYLDMPLQHCDRRILKDMNRSGDYATHLDTIAHIRTRIPDITLRTTLIAGFPGEDEAAFESLCAFVEDAEFDYVGVFPYSCEEGTRAAALPNQVDDDEKLRRAQLIRDIADAVSAGRIARRRGETLDVLVIGEEEDGQLFGRAMCQAPEVDGVVYLPNGSIGEIRPTAITDTLLYEMEGE